jgi:hypothetical protein
MLFVWIWTQHDLLLLQAMAEGEIKSGDAVICILY